MLAFILAIMILYRNHHPAPFIPSGTIAPICHYVPCTYPGPHTFPGNPTS